jgi:hypothetical protein
MLQLTVVDEAFVTFAVNCCVPLAVRVAAVGLIDMPTVVLGETVTLAVPKTLESASLVAVTVTFWVDVTFDEAVYTPFEVIVPVPAGLIVQM